MSFFVDPFGLLFFGAILYIVSANFKFSKQMICALSSAILTSFIFGGVALYMNWYRWIIPGLVDLKGSYIMLDQGLTGHHQSGISSVDSDDVCNPLPSLVRFRLRNREEIQPINQVYPNLHHRCPAVDSPINHTIPIPPSYLNQ